LFFLQENELRKALIPFIGVGITTTSRWSSYVTMILCMMRWQRPSANDAWRCRTAT